MKEVSRQIAFTWRRQDGKDISDSHLEELDKMGATKTNEFIRKGYFEGHLIGSIDDVDYVGYWLISNN